jgi:hypothetical protein
MKTKNIHPSEIDMAVEFSKMSEETLQKLVKSYEKYSKK